MLHPPFSDRFDPPTPPLPFESKPPSLGRKDGRSAALPAATHHALGRPGKVCPSSGGGGADHLSPGIDRIDLPTGAVLFVGRRC